MSRISTGLWRALESVLACTLVVSGLPTAACVHGDSTRADVYRGECERHVPRSCLEIGRMYAEGNGVAQDWQRAQTAFRSACDAGYAKACVDLGVLYENGEGVTQSWSTALDLFDRACDQGAPAGCNDLGNLYAKGEGVDRDPVRAGQLYKKACDAGIEIGCYNAVRSGGLTAASPGPGSIGDGGSPGVPDAAGVATSSMTVSSSQVFVDGKAVDPSIAQTVTGLAANISALAQKLCQDKSAGCYRIDRTTVVPGKVTVFVNGQQVNGEGAQLALGRFRTKMQAECDAGNPGQCYALALMYQLGNGLAPDPARAGELMKKACSGGLQLACGVPAAP